LGSVVRRFLASRVNQAQSKPIQVAFFESHEAGIPDGEPLPTHILGRFTFDPLHTHAIPEATLPLRDLPPLLISLSYAANTGISEVEAEAGINSAVPFGVRGAPDDVAGMIAYLVSDDAAYVTGASFRVDGGWSVISAG